MAKIKIELKDYYIVACVFVAIITMSICYLHRETVNGIIKFVPRIPGKEWWTISTMLLMRMFTAKAINQASARLVQHVWAVVLILLGLAGVFEYVNIDPGSQYWGLVGSVLGVWIGAGQGSNS